MHNALLCVYYLLAYFSFYPPINPPLFLNAPNCEHMQHQVTSHDKLPSQHNTLLQYTRLMHNTLLHNTVVTVLQGSVLGEVLEVLEVLASRYERRF